MTVFPVTLKHDGQRGRATVLAFLPGQLHEPSNIFVVYMLEDSFLVKVAKLSELDLTPEAQVDIDAPLSGPGPLACKQLDCTWPAGPLGPMGLSGPWPGSRSCFSHEGQQCALGDDAATCPYAVWLELDCAGPGADCEGQLVEALPEDAGTELEGVAQLLSDVWSFVDGDDDPEAYVWETIRVGRSPHQLAHTRWVRESAACFMAQARITTGNCEGPGCAF